MKYVSHMVLDYLYNPYELRYQQLLYEQRVILKMQLQIENNGPNRVYHKAFHVPYEEIKSL